MGVRTKAARWAVGRAATRALTVDRTLAVVAAAAVGVRVAFWIVTDRVWEDALITLAHAENAAAGLGLTHHLGEPPTHGFTSALSVLIPLVGEMVAPGSGLFVLRLVSLVATVIALAFAFGIARELRLSDPARAVVLVWLALEQNHIFYGMSGMETQVATAVLSGAIFYALRGGWASAGVLAGLAVLARPDFVIAGPFLMFAWWQREGWLSMVRSSLISAAVVAPWAVFTVSFYGSIVPHTIPAKAATYANLPSGDIAEWLDHQLRSHIEPMTRTFTPFFSDTMVLAAPVPTVVPFAVGAAVWIFVIRGGLAAISSPRWWPIVGIAGVYTGYRVLFLPTSYYDWYLPPYTAVLMFLAALAIDRLIVQERIKRLVPAALGLVILLPLPWFFAMERLIQIEVENGVRRPAAEFVASRIAHGQTLTTEAAGYIGYYSDAVLYDFPGLTSPTAAAAVGSLPRQERSVAGLVDRLRPDWTILRPSERGDLAQRWPEAFASYELVEAVGPGGGQLEVAGLRKASIDLRFEVWRLASDAKAGRATN
jgi:hypothetical protein